MLKILKIFSKGPSNPVQGETVNIWSTLAPRWYFFVINAEISHKYTSPDSLFTFCKQFLKRQNSEVFGEFVTFAINTGIACPLDLKLSLKSRKDKTIIKMVFHIFAKIIFYIFKNGAL